MQSFLRSIHPNTEWVTLDFSFSLSVFFLLNTDIQGVDNITKNPPIQVVGYQSPELEEFEQQYTVCKLSKGLFLWDAHDHCITFSLSVFLQFTMEVSP